MPHPLITLLLCAALLGGCGDWSPGSPEAVLDTLEEAELVTCRERRQPIEGVITCADADNGDLTVGVGIDPTDALRQTRASAGGPWVVGEDWIVISYDGDLNRLRQVRDAIGHGALYQDIDEVPVEVE